jgi:hypothetical protein
MSWRDAGEVERQQAREDVVVRQTVQSNGPVVWIPLKNIVRFSPRRKNGRCYYGSAS